MEKVKQAKLFVLIVFLWLCCIPSAMSFEEVEMSIKDCAKCGIDCNKRYQPGTLAKLSTNGSTKEILVVTDTNECGMQNCSMIAFYYNGETCRQVLFDAGGTAYNFTNNKESDFPNINFSWRMSVDEAIYSEYVWYGNGYVDKEKIPLLKRRDLNKKAIEQFKAGNLAAAISLWEQIDDLGVANPEIINNLGFSYFELGKEEKDQTKFKKAKNYLERALQMQPHRWTALLNLGDLLYEMNDHEGALENYIQLLKVKPNYKHKNDIESKISRLKSE